MGGNYLSSVRPPIVLSYSLCVLTCFAVTMFVFGIVAIQVLDTQFPGPLLDFGLPS
jgi:hypothetical protein